MSERSSGSKGPKSVRTRISDESMMENTGRGWDDWFSRLDAWGATGREHAEIVSRLKSEGAPPWWCQQIAVGYKQERGILAPGQAAGGGGHTANASKTINVSLERLFEAFEDEAHRERWLPASLKVRGTTALKSFRADWEDGSKLTVGFLAKGDAKAHVGLMHEKIADPDQAAELKAFWRERLNVLKELLES